VAESAPRKLGPLLAIVFVANNMIGSGIFLLPATMAAVGSLTIFGWLLALVGALLVGLVLARLGQHVAAAGGPCTYALEAFGPLIGFQSSAAYWFCCWTGNIAVAITATGYLASVLRIQPTPLAAAAIATALLWLATLVNLRGARCIGQLQSGLLAFGLIPVLLIATAGWFYFQPEIFRQSWNVLGTPLLQAIPNSVVLVFWAFTGLESASIAADVVDNPRRNIPIATLGGIMLAGVTYIAASAAIMGLIPAHVLAASTAPFADATRLMLGPMAGALVAGMALIKTMGTLTGTILLTTETARAAANNGLFPAWLAVHNGDGIARRNLLMTTVLTTVVVLATISPTLGAQFGLLVEVSVIATLITYIYACLATWHYGRLGAANLLTPGHRAVAIGASLFCIAVIAMSSRREQLVSAIFIVLTLPAYYALRRRPTTAPVS
jgi:arginine:agmatine antiporter